MKIRFLKRPAYYAMLAVVSLATATLYSCNEDEPLSDLTGITSFSIQGFTESFTIDQTNLTISNTGADSLPYGTVVSSLVAVFEAIENTTVTVNDVAQVSGSTANDFSSTLTYVVTAEDGKTEKSYTVTVNVAQLNPEAASWRRLTENAGWGPWSQHYAATHFNGKFFAYGIQSASITSTPPHTYETYSSTDGITWTKEALTDDAGGAIPPTRDGAIVSGFNGKLWILGGMVPTQPTETGYTFSTVTNKVWSSSDGTTWTVTSPAEGTTIWTAREKAISLVFDNKIWIIGGHGNGSFGALGSPRNDVWSSSDGINWTEVSANGSTAFTARTNPAGVVHNGKLYIIGGKQGVSSSGTTFYNDVWTSTDGATWTQVITGTNFPARTRHKVISYDGKLWLIGGESYNGTTTTRYSDLWVSEDDGANWTEITSENILALPASFKARCYHALFVVDESIWIIGGIGAKNESNSDTYLNDVWTGTINKYDGD